MSLALWFGFWNLVPQPGWAAAAPAAVVVPINAKTLDLTIVTRRKILIDAVAQGYMDTALAADLDTCMNNGFKPGRLTSDGQVDLTPIGGINS